MYGNSCSLSLPPSIQLRSKCYYCMAGLTAHHHRLVVRAYVPIVSHVCIYIYIYIHLMLNMQIKWSFLRKSVAYSYTQCSSCANKLGNPPAFSSRISGQTSSPYYMTPTKTKHITHPGFRIKNSPVSFVKSGTPAGAPISSLSRSHFLSLYNISPHMMNPPHHQRWPSE